LRSRIRLWTSCRDAFERQLAQLDVGKAVEDQLAALKREVGGG